MYSSIKTFLKKIFGKGLETVVSDSQNQLRKDSQAHQHVLAIAYTCNIKSMTANSTYHRLP